MNEPDLSPVKRALLEIRELRARVSELEGAAHEPIAIVGMGLRVPGGVHDADSFAKLLWSGTDAIGPIPPERWKTEDWYDQAQDAPGRMTVRHGGFIDGVDRFDAAFFGIAPLEAASMDPQQRLVLELAWHALEDAGLAPASLAGRQAGVYLGIANGDYGRALFARTELIDTYFSVGNAYSVASGRIAYLLGLHGPAMSIDTACSSSLVALHLACDALRRGECELALAGGVNLILSPEMHIAFSKGGMMARDGHCKTFDAAADGYVRGEGGAIVVLRRLRDALADGDRVLAVVRGSAINQDGRSNGLTAPNGPAQEAVVRAALAAAGVAPAQVGYVETHGTGTPLGDPIEVNALGAVLREGRDPARPVAIGSVKTNLGHLEAAAGIVGLAKAVLALQRHEIPPHLNFSTPNPYIDWSLPLVVPTAVTPWAPIDGRRIAGVSSFGFSGTNAHVVLEEAPAVAAAAVQSATRPLQVLALSGRDSAALDETVATWRDVLATQGADAALGDLCFTAAAGRNHHAQRVAVQGAGAAEMDAALAAWQARQPHPALFSGRASAAPPRIAFLFPGQGPQYAGMGRALYDAAPVFRDTFDRCCAVLDGLLPQPLKPIVFGDVGAGLLDETIYAQPAMYTMEVALAALWRSWGVEPVAVMGHSFGEYAAAQVAGAVSLEDGARMVAARGRLAQGLPRDGAMIVIEAAEADVAAAIAQRGARAAIAAVNGPSTTVLSGERGAVEAIAAEFAARGARTKPLRVSHAFHSPLIDPVLDEFERALAPVQFAAPRLPLVSNLSGRLADLALIGTPAYWRRHLREPVRFADALAALAALGITHYIEMSPHPVLLGMGSELVDGAQWLPSLREGREAWPVLLESLQALYVGGAQIDWDGFDRGQGRRRVAVPVYAFQRQRHWIDAAPLGSTGPAPGAAERWSQVGAALDRQAERGPLDLNAASYPAKYAALAQLTSAHAIDTLRRAGLYGTPGESHTVEQVLEAAGIAPTYGRLVQRWMERLAEAGLLRHEGGAFIAVQPLPAVDLDALWAQAEPLFADNRPLFDYARHCGRLAADVLCGRESPLETLFPGGSFELAQGLYERSSTMRYINQLAAAAFEALGAATPAGRVLRVMEVGAGTGGTSSSLLPALPAQRRRYHFTDVSDAFMTQARMRFAAEPGVSFGLFDLERELAEQGYEAGSFDVVVSANAVHAARDLRATLRRLRELLAPGGLLVLVESTEHLDYFDMTTGLIEGWQHFEDDLRGDNPLLPPATWIAALEAAGFAQARAWPGDGSVAAALGQHVIVARVAGEGPAGEVAAVHTDTGTVSAPAMGVRHGAVETERADWLAELDGLTPDARVDRLRERVREQVMQVMRLDAASSPAFSDRLMDLGMDSLMAVQLRNRLARGVGLDKALPATVMFDHPTIDGLAAYLVTRLAPAAKQAPSRVVPPAAAAMDAGAVADMSDAEVEALLLKRLGDA